MIVKEIRDEDFISYKKPAMVIGFPSCSWKCGEELCQNSSLAQAPNINIGFKTIVNRYINNPITSAIVMGGLEPMDSYQDIVDIITYLRAANNNDDVVIFTGYEKSELQDRISELYSFGNIIIKWGRFRPNEEPHYDEILGVKLASSNQYAERIS
jgi:hypothetical protein